MLRQILKQAGYVLQSKEVRHNYTRMHEYFIQHSSPEQEEEKADVFPLSDA